MGQQPENRPGALDTPVARDHAQVSAVDVNLSDDPVIFHRGPVEWNAKSFDKNHLLVARKEKPIQVWLNFLLPMHFAEGCPF